MAKKSGKVAVAQDTAAVEAAKTAQAAATEAAAEAESAEASEKKNGVFLNRVSAKSMHGVMLDTSGKWQSVAVNLSEPGSNNPPEWGTFLVRPKQVFESTDKNGAKVEGKFNVLLGDADRTIRVNVHERDEKGNAVKDESGKDVYKSIEMTAAQIKSVYDANRKAYRNEKSAEESKVAKAESIAPEAPAAADEPAYSV